MQIEISIDPDRHVAMVHIAGRLDMREVARAAAAFVDHPDFTPGMPAIFDLRDVDFASFGAAESRAISEINRRLASRRGSARVALLVESDLGFGVLRMHEVLGQSPNLQVRVFRDMVEAQHWVLGPFTPGEPD